MLIFAQGRKYGVPNTHQVQYSVITAKRINSLTITRGARLTKLYLVTHDAIFCLEPFPLCIFSFIPLHHSFLSLFHHLYSLSVQGQMFVAFSKDRDHYAVLLVNVTNTFFYIVVYSVRDSIAFRCGGLQIPTRGLLVLLGIAIAYGYPMRLDLTKRRQ